MRRLGLVVLMILLGSLLPPNLVLHEGVFAQAGPPDIAVSNPRYTVENGKIIVSVPIENEGGPSSSFNLTFSFVGPISPPEPGEVPFTWLNTSRMLENSREVSSGEVVNGSVVLRDDDGYIIYELPFELNFFGIPVKKLSVSTNGYVELMAEYEDTISEGDYEVWDFLSESRRDFVAGLDEDLETEDGYLLVARIENGVVIEWFGSTWDEYDSENYPINFQLLILSNGTLVWSYGRLRAPLSYGKAGYFSRVSLESREIEPEEGKSYSVNLPQVTPTVLKVQIPPMGENETRSVSVTSPVDEGYVRIFADLEGTLNDVDRSNNFAELWLWPGNYWIENVSIGNVTPGEFVEVNFTVKTTSRHPEPVTVRLLKNGEVELEHHIWNPQAEGLAGGLHWLAQGGSYNLSLEIDVMGDTNLSDNRAHLGEYSFPLPNFRIANYSVKVPHCSGSPAMIRVNVTNDGSLNWSNVEVMGALMYSDGTMSPSWAFIPFLPAGKTAEVLLEPVVAPGNITGVRIEVDPYDRVDESSEDDNSVSVELSVSIEMPDFTVVGVEIPSNVTTGKSYQVNVTLDNLGGCYAGIVGVRLYENGRDEDWEYVEINGTTEIGLRWSPSAIGWVNLTVAVDPYNVIAELREDNNELTERVLVRGPDITITNVELVSFDGIAGSPAVFNVMLKNLGESFTSGFYVKAYGGLGTSTIYVPGGLSKGEEKTVEMEIYANAGNVTLYFKADSSNRITETNESNNGFSYELDVPLPNFKVEAVSLPENTVGYVPVNVTVRNIGAPYNGTRFPLTLKVSIGGRSRYYYIRNLFGSNETITKLGTIIIQAPGGLVNASVYSNVNETSKSDNWLAVNVSTGYPDLVVEIHPPEVSAGSYVRVNYTVRNTGNATLSLKGTSLPVKYGIEYEDGRRITGGTWISNLVLAPNGTAEIRPYLKFNGGRNILFGVIDEANRWVESNEDNNNATLLLELDKPDFAIANYSIPDEVLNGSAYLYHQYEIEVNVTNLGGEFKGHLIIALLVDGRVDEFTGFYNLGKNETKEVTLYYRPEPGKHNLTIALDYSNEWIEGRKDNNNATVTTAEFGMPDVTPVGVTWEPYNFTSGERVTFKVYLKNLGQAFEKSFTTRVEIWNGSTRLTYGTAYPYPYGYTFRENETREFRWVWYGAEPGNLTLRVVADYYNYLPEANETNNNLTVDLGSVGTPDFELSNLSVGKPAFGRWVDVNVTLRNLGEGIYRPFNVLFNLSGRIYYETVYGIGANETRILSRRWYVDRTGELKVSVGVDPRNEIAETNETNNWVSGIYNVEPPELSIVSYRWERRELASGYLAFTVNVTNSGGDTYRGFYLAMYVDGSLKARVWVPELLSGETSEKALRWRLDTGGMHEVWLVVDDGNLIPETDEDNNIVKTNVTIELPDIEVEGLSVPEMHANALFTVNVTLRNSGIQDIERPFFVAVYQDDKYLGGAWVDSLPAGDSKRVGIAVRPYPGDSIITAVADQHNTVVEASEDNNELSVAVHVSAPDLRVISFFPGNPRYSGETANATVLIRNEGDHETGAFQVVIRENGRNLGSVYVESLMPGEELNATVPWKAEPGRYNVTAVADPYNVIREWDEGNNALSVPVVVPAPDLSVLSFSYSGGRIAGESMSFTVTVANRGNTTLLPFYVVVYANPTVIGVKRLNGLPSEGVRTIYFENSWKARYGSYVLRAVVDPYNRITELREDNNEANVSVFIDDETPPSVVTPYPANGSFTNEALIGVLLSDEGSGVDLERSRLSIYREGVPVEGSSEASWGWLVFRNSTPLLDGNYTVILTAADRAGNSMEYSWNFVLDRKAPVISSNITNGTLYNGSVVPAINVSDENLLDYRVTVNGREFHGGEIKADGSYLLEVFAVDRAGNKARYSAWFMVNGVPHPPSGLTLRMEGKYVELSWLPSGDSDIAGHYVYVDGKRLNEEPVEVTAFRDVLRGSLNYSVTAVDFMGFESEPVQAFPVRLGIETERMVVGYPTEVRVNIENLDGPANGTLRLELVDVFGNIIEGIIRNVGLIPGNGTENFEVVVPQGLGSLRASLTINGSATLAVLPVIPEEAEAPVILPQKLETGLPGLVEVRLKNHGSRPLDTSKATLRLGNITGEAIGALPAIPPGEEAILRYRVVPRGRGLQNLTFRLGYLSAAMEVEIRDPVTSPVMVSTENFVRGARAKVYVTFRNTGTAPLRVLDVEVLGMRRSVGLLLPPNLSVELPFEYTVPQNASRVLINATVFTDVGTFGRSIVAETTEPTYNANVTVKPVFKVGEDVLIEGFAYNSSGPLANVPVKVSVLRGDFVREYYVVTDGTGRFNLTFRPLGGEYGHFIVSATHPAVVAPERDGEFDIVGLTLVPDVYDLTVTREFSGEIEVEIINHWLDSNVSVDVSAPEAYNVTVPRRIELKSGRNRLKIGLSSQSAVNGTMVITFRAVQLGIEVEKNLTVRVNVLPPTPRIELEPLSLDVGLLTNESVSRTITVKNTGFEELRNVSVVSSIEWVKIVSAFTGLEAGKSGVIGLYIAPPENLTGTFEGSIRISSSNYRDVYVPIRITVTPNARGSLRVVVMDPNATKLEKAEVTLYNGYAHFEGKTDENGTVLFTDVPIGEYTLIVGEESHYTSSRKVIIEAGLERNLTVVLMPSVLEVEWEVVPVTIEDVYIIKHEIGYTTYVPAPEIKTYGGDLEVYIDYEKLAELGMVEFRGQLIIRNTHRYVSVFNITFESGGSHYIDVEFMVDRIDELKPGETVTVPYVVRVYYQRSPPINPCLHETKVFTLKAGVVCVEEAGKITLRAQKVHRLIVKPTCDGCWKSLLNIGAHILFEKLSDKLGDLLENNEIAKDSGDKALEALKELYEAYYQMSMNPTDENIKNYEKTLQKFKGTLLEIGKTALAKYGEKYLENYLSTKGIEFDLILDEKGQVVGFVMPSDVAPMYPEVMSTVNVQNGNVQVSWEEAEKLADKLTGGLISELKEKAENLWIVEMINLIVKLVDDYTPMIAEAGMNCAICLLRNNCSPPNVGEMKPIQLIRTAYFTGYDGGGAGGVSRGGVLGETSVGRFTCEGLPRPENSTSQTSQPTAQSCPACGIETKLSDTGERKICVNLPLRDLPSQPLQEDGDGEAQNTLHMCVDLVITIEQRLTFERQAFRASLRFTNTNANYSLEDVNVSLVFLDDNANDAGERFFVRLDERSGLNNGVLKPKGEASFRWLIVPKVGAAREFRTRYYVMANVTARLGDSRLVFETWPAVIEVKPVPQLELDYMIPRKVYGDDPYTPEIEQPVPFIFGLRVKNVGYGEAKNLRIASAQPRIERSNYPGVYIDFKLLGTIVNGNVAPNSLTVNFGDLKPGESSTAAWIMSAEVTGDFVYYNATFQHSDELGGNETSLIRALRTHFLFRAFNDTANDDGMMDFLVDDDGDAVPERIIDSNGEDYPVLKVNFTEEYGRGFRKVIPLVKSPGWIYMAIPVSGFTRATRSDGKEPVAQWIDNGTLHLLDLGTAEFYVLKANRPPVPVMSLSEPVIVNRTVTLDASLSYDPDGRIVRYLWRIGDDTLEGPVVSYTFREAGNYTIILTVWDGENSSSSMTRNVRVYLGPRFVVEVGTIPEWGIVPFNVTVNVSVANAGDAPGTYNLSISIDGQPEVFEEVTLQAGGMRNLTFQVEITSAGEHVISVDGKNSTVLAYWNVSLSKNETLEYSRDFGFYDSLTWEPFVRDFDNWTTQVLENVSLPELTLERILDEKVSNWALANRSENLNPREREGDIRAIYSRNATIRGISGWNYTTVRVTQRVVVFANASHRLDEEPPTIRVTPESGVYERIPVLNVTVIDETNVTVWVETDRGRENLTLLLKDGNVSVWSGMPPLGPGNNTVIVYAEDYFGNQANETLWIYLNPKAPIVTIESPEERVYNSRQVWINYTVIDDDLVGVKAYLDGRLVSTNSSWSAELVLDYGTHNLTVEAWDVSNNVTETVTFRINEPPTVNFTWSAKYLEVSFQANSSDPDGIIEYLWDFGDGSTGRGANVTHVYANGGVYNVTLIVWDAYNLSSSSTKTIEVFANVSLRRNETLEYTRDFGFYNSTSWESFKRDFEEWVNRTLRGIEVPETGLDEVWSVKAGNWSLVNHTENLLPGSGNGWINATYRRLTIVKGLIDHNETTMLVIQRAVLFGSATNVRDVEPPFVKIVYPENRTYDHNVTELIVFVNDSTAVASVVAELDGEAVALTQAKGSWRAEITAGDGRHRLVVIARDIWNNTAVEWVNFTVNTTVRITEINGTEIVTIPGELESAAIVQNGLLRITLGLGGETVSLGFSLRKRVLIDERLWETPWLAVRSGMTRGEISVREETIRRAGRLYERRTFRVEATGQGYAVLMLPLNGMDVVRVTIEKNGTTYELGTADEGKPGHYGILGGYLYVVIHSDPIIEVELERVVVQRASTDSWLLLGFAWQRWYLKLREEFTELREKTCNETFLEEADELHTRAEEYYLRGISHYPNNPIWYAIYMRKAYLLEKQAVEIVRRCT
ncbi:CARDB domain-containing protein [Thermococcus sp. ES12]|uniref:CARDB domain-containing protein n=1 Tax=Thermococcus sp. ES12 TaxID=1638246 RepID=UPI001F104470|nr:CARDB domain-containing protein [Thermococcus sp. ES12]